MTTITPIPTPVPSRSDPANFSVRGDAFLGALPTLATEINIVAGEINTAAASAASSAASAGTSATTAYNQAQAAATSAASAAAAGGASLWVSGTSYVLGNVVWSPLTYLSYRRKSNGAGTTDPSLDTTNWALIGAPSTFPTTAINSNTTAAASNHYILLASLILSLPVAPPIGTAVQFSNLSNTRTCVINPGSEKIRGVAGSMNINSKNVSAILVYTGTTLGWV